MLGLVGVSSTALFSSFYFQYVEGYEPCIYCYVLRYLTIGILAVSAFGALAGGLAGGASAVLVSLGLVGTGVSSYLILDETFPNASICTACSVTPMILGISLYYYSIAFMTIVLGLSISMLHSD